MMAESYVSNVETENTVSPLKTASASVIRSQARAIENGGRRLHCMLKPDAAEALDALKDAARKLGR